MPPLSVAWTPHYVKKMELGHSHYLGLWQGRSLVFAIGYVIGQHSFKNVRIVHNKICHNGVRWCWRVRQSATC